MTQINTPKFVEEVIVEVMQVDKVAELFETTAIVSLNMGNLTLEVNTLQNKLAIGEKEKDFQKGYKHNVEIWTKNRAEAEHKVKMILKKLQDENEELKGSITQLRSQDEKLQDLRQKYKFWETTERKWTKVLFLHK